MRANVYVDGFNFYYRCVKNTEYKWLNLRAMMGLVYPSYEIGQLRYFTAKVKPPPNDPQMLQRQETYLRALRTIPNLSIHLGRFLSHRTLMPYVKPSGGRLFAEVVKTDEKGSDVNLACHLLLDGFRGQYDVAIVVTNDSDLAEPVRMVRQELGLRAEVLCPNLKGGKRSWALKQAADDMRLMRESYVKYSQFPNELRDDDGEFSKPIAWQ